jgi:hypothetical protein
MVDVCSSGERRERPWEDVALFSEWVALVMIISECE